MQADFFNKQVEPLTWGTFLPIMILSSNITTCCVFTTYIEHINFITLKIPFVNQTRGLRISLCLHLL